MREVMVTKRGWVIPLEEIVRLPRHPHLATACLQAVTSKLGGFSERIETVGKSGYRFNS